MPFPLRALLLLALIPGLLLAQQGGREPVREPVEPLERSELPESVLRIERQTGGEVLRAERMQRDGREVYRLKVLTPDGRVRIMREDPRERRRDAWRESRGLSGLSDGASRDDRSTSDLESPPEIQGPAFSREPEREFRRDNADVGRAPEPRPEPMAPPSELAMPETLPPVERGDQQQY